MLIDQAHVERWVHQFEPDEREVVVEGTKNLLTFGYFSRCRAHALVQQFLFDENVFTMEPQIGWLDTKFLSIQRHGQSQTAANTLAADIMYKDDDLCINDCGTSPSQYVYLDDFLFTGNTLLYDLLQRLPNVEHPRNLYVFLYGGHSQGLNYVRKRFYEHSVAELWNLQIMCSTVCSNDPSGVYEGLWPVDHQCDAATQSFIQRLQTHSLHTPRLFRSAFNHKRDRIFASNEQRHVVEKAFLRKGAYILSHCQEPKHEMRPLGFEKLESLGFGATLVSYRNVANNCPLALWWGDPEAPAGSPLRCWLPLFRRRGNRGD